VKPEPTSSNIAPSDRKDLTRNDSGKDDGADGGSGGLSTGAKIGIGVGVGVVAIVFILVGFAIYQRGKTVGRRVTHTPGFAVSLLGGRYID